MAAPSSQDFMARLAAARTPVKTPGQDDLEARTPAKTPLRTPVKTPLRTTAQLEETIFNELMDADHGPHWTSPAKSDEELFVEIAKENGSSVASDEEAAPPVYEAVRPPPAPPPSAARPPSSTPPHLAEALAPYAALAKGSPEDVRQRLRAATTTLRRRLDAGLPLRTLVWDRMHGRSRAASGGAGTRRPGACAGGIGGGAGAASRRRRPRRARSPSSRRRRPGTRPGVRGAFARAASGADAVAESTSRRWRDWRSKNKTRRPRDVDAGRQPPPPEDAETRAGQAFLKAVQRRRGVDSQAKADHERWLEARRGGAPSAPDDSDSSDDDGAITIRGDTAHVRWSTLEGVLHEIQPKGPLPDRNLRTFSLLLADNERLDLAVDDAHSRRSLVSGFGSVAAAMRNREGVRPLDVLFDDALRKCDGALLVRDGIEDAAKTRRRDLLERCGLRRLHALYRDDQHPELDGSIAKGTLVHVAHDICPESGEAPYTVEFPVPREKGESRRYVKLRQPCPLFAAGSYVTGEVIGHAAGSYVVRYVSGPHLHTKDSLVEELFGGEERKEEESLLERPPRMPEGTLLKGVKREFLEVDVAYQKRDFAPWFTLLSLLVYWVKFFVDLSGGDEVMGSLDDALEAVAPFADDCRLQTHDFRRLVTYQFVHVDAGHLVANSIILLVLGSPLEMAHGPIVGVAFEAGVVLGAVASLVFAPYQRVVGFSAGVYCVLGVHFGHLLLHWADMRRGALNRWARLFIFAAFFGVDVVYSYAEQVSATIHLAGFVVGVVLSAAVLRDLVERPRSFLRVTARGLLVVLPVLLVLRYAFYVVRADPPEPLTWLSGGDVTDCCYVLRKCGVADELYARFSCRDLNDKRLFRGSATALYGGGLLLAECSEVDAFLL